MERGQGAGNTFRNNQTTAFAQWRFRGPSARTCLRSLSGCAQQPLTEFRSGPKTPRSSWSFRKVFPVAWPLSQKQTREV